MWDSTSSCVTHKGGNCCLCPSGRDYRMVQSLFGPKIFDECSTGVTCTRNCPWNFCKLHGTIAGWTSVFSSVCWCSIIVDHAKQAVASINWLKLEKTDPKIAPKTRNLCDKIWTHFPPKFFSPKNWQCFSKKQEICDKFFISPLDVQVLQSFTRRKKSDLNFAILGRAITRWVVVG